MKYKIGDKVQIKTWEQLVKEFGFKRRACIDTQFGFTGQMEEELDILNCDRNLIIKDIRTIVLKSHHPPQSEYYVMEEMVWNWDDEMIECLVEDDVELVSTPIKSRFEILDL